MKKIILISSATVLMFILISLLSGRGKDDTKEKDLQPMMQMETSMEMSMDSTQPVPPPGTEGENYNKPSDRDLKKILDPLQYEVTQMNGTERAYSNDFWDNKKEGIYVDIVSGEPLFSSTDKYKSGTGWPSFTKPLEEGNVINIQDSSYGMVRIEVRSLFGDSHLGHLFNDGPKPSGMRYCINSASLKFVAVEDMKKQGYGNYLYLFEEG